MRIMVSAADTPISDDQRAYAEYRLFSTLARYDTSIRSITIHLQGHHPVLCRVGVDLGASGRVEAQARAAHQSAAIDRAADRAGSLLARRIGDRVSA